MILKYSVGIDIAFKTFRSCIVSIDDSQNIKVVKTRTFVNSKAGFLQFKKWYDKVAKKASYPMCFTMEATGVYHENLAHFLHADGQKISIVLANHSKKFIESLGMKSKNDPLDSLGLATMGAQRKLKVWDPPARFYADLRALTRQYQTLQELKTAECNRMHALKASSTNPKLVLKQIKQILKYIDKQIEELKVAIRNHLNTDVDVRRRVDQITKIKGVGEQTVAVIISETYGFELFKNAKQLISYSGYDVVENQSGNRIGKTRISKKGNSRIRRAMFMPAFGVVKAKQKVFFNLYWRTFDKHKIKMKSYVAVQKKLLTTIYALWRKDEDFDNNYQQIEKKEQESKKVAPNKRELHQVQAQ